MSKKLFAIASLLIVASMILGACAPAATPAAPQVVTKEVEKVVEKQVEVTPTPVDTAALRDAVGVKAVDDTTIQITLKEPAGYFPSIAGLWVTYPQLQATIDEQKNKWTEAGLITTDGPYSLAEWSHGASLKLVGAAALDAMTT